MFKAINGWTKEKMLEVLKKRKSTKAAFNKKRGLCEYRTACGNRCAIGMFIPSKHLALKFSGGVERLLRQYRDLRSVLPLDEGGLSSLQYAHDSMVNTRKSAKKAMIDWVEKNVE